MTSTLYPRSLSRLLTAWIRLNPLINVPSGSTSTWLPIVCCNRPGWKIDLAGPQVSPPSVDRANHASEKKLTEFSKALAEALSLGDTIRCHVAYTRSASPGSAVRVSLSLKLL